MQSCRGPITISHTAALMSNDGENRNCVSCYFFFLPPFPLLHLLQLTRWDGGSSFDVADVHIRLLLEQYIPKKGKKKKNSEQINVGGTLRYWPTETSDLQQRNFLERQVEAGGWTRVGTKGGERRSRRLKGWFDLHQWGLWRWQPAWEEWRLEVEPVSNVRWRFRGD